MFRLPQFIKLKKLKLLSKYYRSNNSNNYTTMSLTNVSDKKEKITDDELDTLFSSLCKIKSTEHPIEKKDVKTLNIKEIKADKKIMDIETNQKPIFTSNEYTHYTGPFGKKAKFDSPEKEYEWAKTQIKECNKCKEELPLSEFGYNTSGQDPFDRNGCRLRRGDCKECNKMANKE